MERQELSEKNYQFLLHLLDTSETKPEHTVLQQSKVEIEADWRHSGALIFYIIIDPEVYKNYQTSLSWIGKSIAMKFRQFTNIWVTDTQMLPDLNKFQILDNKLVPIITPWEEINNNQQKLIEELRGASESLDFQGIGLIARTIMQKLANIVFEPSKHKHNNPNAELSDGKYKNQLTAFIDTTLAGNEHKKFRKLAEASIEMLENSSDFMNSATHKLNAEKYLAELCAISTISAISIVRLVKELE
ncbi:MAG: hypothetical protein ACN4EP_03585 [Sediminibacterium sp.]